jgi:hypothetical protein
MASVAAGAALAGFASGIGVTAAGALTYTLTAASFWTAFTSTLVLGGLNYALAKQQDAPKLSVSDPGRNTTIKQPAAPRRTIYGRARTGGVYAYISNTGPKNAILHLVIMWAGHECDAVEKLLLDDKDADSDKYNRLAIDASTAVSFTDEGGGEGRIHIEGGGFTSARLTKSDQILEVTGSGSNDGIYRIKNNPNRTDTTDSMLRVYRIDRSGAQMTDEPAGATVTIRERYIWANHHLGAPDQPADADMLARLSDWTEDHRLRGICYSYVALAWSREKWPSGIPTITAVIRGKKLYDPRTGAAAWSENPALCVADYLTDADGLGVDYASAISEPDLIAAANVCQEQVTVTAGSVDRYTCNGTFTSDSAPEDIIPKLCASMAGTAIKAGGLWRIKAGAYETPTVELTDDDLRGPVRLIPRMPRDEIFNAVRARYVSAAEDYTEVDAPPVTNALYESQDAGERIWRDIELPFTTSAQQAQRLEKIALEQQRQQIRVVYPAKLSALRLTAGETVLVTRARYGWDQKPFYIEDWSFEVYDDENGEPALGVLLHLRETAAGVYDWNLGEETTVDLSPDTDLPDPTDLPAPTGLDLASGSAELLVASDGTVISRIHATWDQADSVYVDEYDVRYRLSTDEGFDYQRVTAPGAWISPVKDLALYDVGVRSRNSVNGAASDWVEIVDYQVEGKTAPPSAPDSFTFQRQQDGTREFQWEHAAPEPDVRVGGGYKIRFRLGTGWAWADMDPLHDGLLQVSPYETNALAAGTYTFAIKTVDSTGNESETAKYIVAELGDPRGAQNSIAFVDVANAGWPGTKTDCVVDAGNVLRAVNQGTWDTLPATWDAWTRWVADPVATFSYEHPPIDIGIVGTFTPLVSVDTASTATVEVATSSDGVTYTGWSTPAGAVEARYIKVRVIIQQAGSELPLLYGLLINLSARPVDETITDLDTSTLSGVYRLGVGDIRLPIDETYGVIRTVQIALQSVGPGWTWVLEDKDTATGPRVRLYDASGNPADALIDAFVRGL